MAEAAAFTAPSSWPTYGVPDLMNQVIEAQTEGKNLFIWDKTDNIDTFFKYKGWLCDFHF